MATGATFELLTERAGERLGFARFAEWVGHPGLAPYLTPLFGWVLDVLVLSTASYVLVGRETYEAPAVWVIPVGVVVGVRLTGWLRDRYIAAVRNLPGNEVDVDGLLAVPAGRVRVTVYLAIVAVGYVQLAFTPAEVSAFVNVHGEVVAALKLAFVGPFYYVLFADVVTVVAASMLVLPWRLYNTDLSLDFSDVTGFAGLYEVGRLLWAGAIAYFVGLAAWTLFLVLPSIAGVQDDIWLGETILFAALWVGGVLLYLAPVVLLHRHMAREKARHIRAIDDEIRALDPEQSDPGRGIPYLEPEAEDIPRLQQKFVELQQVRHAREYPANMAIVEELAFAALVPLAFQWALSNLTVFG